MKRFISSIIFFCVLAIILDYAYGTVCNYLLKNAKSGANKELNNIIYDNQNDILIMGSSKASHNYIPQIIIDSLGIPCYNIGKDGNGILLAYGILTAIPETKLPKLIIYDCKQQFDLYKYAPDCENTRYYGQLKPYCGLGKIDSLIYSISKSERVKLLSNFYRYNSSSFNLLKNYLNYNPNEFKLLGYHPLRGKMEMNKPQIRDYNTTIDSVKYDALVSFIEYTKLKNIKLLIIITPEVNTSYSSDLEPIVQLCHKREIECVNFYNDTTFTNHKEYFNDYCHLNNHGANVFTKHIIPHIRKAILID